LETRDSNLTLSNIAAYAVLTVVLLLLAAVWLQAFYHYREEHEIQRKVIDPPVAEVQDYLREQNERLGSYAWIDKEKGIVRLPIERAMELVVREKGGRR